MNDATGHWLNGAGRQPLLTPAEELHLGAMVQRWQRWDGGPDAAPAAVRRRGLRARDRMVAANLRLVVTTSKKWQARARVAGLEVVDLLQAGSIGLQRAAELFDPTRGFKFSTYATPWISQAMGRLVERQMAGGSVPQEVGRAVAKVRAGYAEMDQLPINLQRRAKAALLMATTSSLDAAVSDDGTPLIEMLAA